MEDEFLREYLDADNAMLFRAGELLQRVRSEHQLIEVYDTPHWGKLLRLDNCNMTSERDEFIYHENLIHPAALMHSSLRHVLIIGGGDGGAAEECLKHRGVERVTVAELDSVVVDVAKKHLQSIHHGVFNDPRLTLWIGDGAVLLRESREQYDLIVLDLTDPDGPAAALYTRDFFASCKRALKQGGAISLHIGAPHYQPQRFRRNLDDLQSVFDSVHAHLVFVPTYGALWGMATASHSFDPGAWSAREFDAEIARRGLCDLQYCNGRSLAAGFALPKHIAALANSRQPAAWKGEGS